MTLHRLITFAKTRPRPVLLSNEHHRRFGVSTANSRAVVVMGTKLISINPRVII